MQWQAEVMYSAVIAGKNDKIEISQKIYDIKRKMSEKCFFHQIEKAQFLELKKKTGLSYRLKEFLKKIKLN